jgi:hypothetical protein
MYPFDFSHPVVGRASVEIEKPLATVFNFVGEQFFDNYPKWSPEVSEFKPLNGHQVSAGARAQQVRVDQGQRVESVFEVTSFEPPTQVTLSGLTTPYRNTYRLEQCGENSSTRLEYSFELLELDIFMRPFVKLIRMAIEEGAENTVVNIKNLLVECR